MSFNYNNEVLDLLLKKTLGSAYTSADLVSGQETPVLPKIQNSQIFTNRITDANASNFTWSSTSNVTGGGTVSYLDVVTGETSTFQYIKKYEAIPMSVVAGTNNRAWKPTDSGIQEKFENVILGKPNFSFSITTDITNYTTIYSTNSLYKPVINNGVLVFLGNSVPTSTTVISMKEVYIYEGAFGTTTGMLISDISNVNISSPQDGQPLIYDNASQKWIAGTVGKDYIPISTLDTIDDVSLNGLTTGQTIGYDGFKWVPKDVPVDFSDISDVDLSGAVGGQGIIYDASSGIWKPGNVQTPLQQLGDIADVKFDVGPYDGQGLVWKDVSSCWIAKDIQTPLNSLDDVSGIDLSGIVPGQTIVLDISGIFVPKTIGEVIENLSDLKDVDVSNLADQIPQWTQKNRLEASDAAVSDNFGFASALDISYALVGSPNANSNSNADVGKAYLYKKNFFLGTYSEDQVLMSTLDNGNMNFGYSVSIGRNVLMVGAPNHSYNPGSGFKEKAGTVFFYNYSEITEKWGVVNGSIYNENSKIQPGTANDQFGFSMDIDISNNWCIIGSPQQLANGNGKADIYENVTGTWTHRKTLTASDGAGGDNFGVSVRINDENTFAFVGADNHDSAKGAVYIYKKNHPNANDWGQYQKIVSLDQRINSYFGKSIGVNGSTLLIGSPNGGNFSGAAYEVTYSSGTGKWGTQSGSDYLPSSDKIVALDASANDQYGYSVDVYENFGVIGSKSTDMSGNVDTGSAYIIINTGEGYWEESKQVNPDDLDVQDEYGISVAIFGRSIVIGSWLSEGDQGGDPAHAGSAYIFNLPNPAGGTKALIYDTDYNRWKVGSVAPSDEAVVTKLGLLDDVDVTTIANDNVLAYNDASGNWKPATMGSLMTIGDISDVDLSGVATGKAIVWDASLNKWIIGNAGGGSASGVTSTNIQPTVDNEGDPLTGGKLYYDTSWNSFHGRTAEGWQELLLSNTNLLFGAPPRLKKDPYLETLLNVFPDRYEFCWENPPQYVTSFSASNAADYVNGDLYLPVINHIKFEFFETSDNETFGSTTRGIITVGGKSGIGRTNINGNTTQTLTNAAGSNKITNKIVLYTYGSNPAVGVADGWTNLNTSNGSSYEYDFIDIDASGNQVYYFNPRSNDFGITAQTAYSFRMWVENSITPHNYRVWGGVTTQIVNPPTAIKVADPGQSNGFYAEIVHVTSGVHKIKVVVPKEALTAAGVEVAQGETGVDNSVFFEAFEVQYQTVNAVTNENVETSAITGWTGTGADNWSGEESTEQIFDEGTGFGVDTFSAIPSTIPLQNKNSFTTVSKHITVPEFDNKFYRFRVRAKNQVETTYGPWSTDYYVVRFTRPQKMVWDDPPPLFLTKAAHPDKWFITLTWQDTYSSDGGVSTGDDNWSHDYLAVAEFRLTRSTNNGSSYTIVDNEDGDKGSTDAKLSYDYCVASASDTTQKWTNPQYKFKIEARNYLFGTSSNDANAWSTISETSVSLIPTTPVTPTHLQMKFYEQSQTNGTNPASYYTADPWTAPSNDYILYQWNIDFSNTGSGYGTSDYNGVTIGEANKLTPEQYQLEYLVGKANISGSTLRLVPTTEATGNYDDFRNTELLANDYYRLGTGTTVYQVSSVSSDVKKHILNHTGSETGIVEIYKVLYINATDKNFPGANPYYPRVYNVAEYRVAGTGLTSLLRNASWTYTVKAKNYFVSTASSGFTSPSAYAITSPSNVRFIASPTIDISNSKIILSFNEPDTSAKTRYANNPEIFNTPDAIDYKSYGVEPFINNVSQSNHSVYTTAQSATRREVSYNHTRESNSNALNQMVEGDTSTIKYKFRPENLLHTLYGDVVETEFKILKPAPTDMDAIPLFEWQSDGTNNIKLTLRRSEGGLEPNTSNSNTGSTICPVTSLSSTGGDTATMRATTDELYWQVKSSTSFSGGITTTYTDIASQGWSNTDYVIANIGTMTHNTLYTIKFRLKNRYISDYKESLSPKIKLTTPNAPTEFAAVVDIVDDNAGNDNKMTFNWTRPSEPGLHYNHNGDGDQAALVADPDTPYIEKYEISFLDGNASNTEYRFWVSGGNASTQAPTSFTLTGSIPTSNVGGTFYLMPDRNYHSFKIRAYNVRLTSSASDYSTAVSATYVSRTRITGNPNYGVPYSIADNDQTYDNSLKVTWNLGGDYAYQSHATLLDGTAASNVKNWNTINNETANIGPILMNRHYNKPGTSDFASFYIRFQHLNASGSATYTHDAYPASGAFDKDSGNGDHLTQVEKQPHNESTHTNVSGKYRGYINIQTMADLFTAGHNNTGQWYKVSTMHFGIIKNNVKDYWSGMKMNAYSYFYYKNSANATVGSTNSTICSNQYFDKINEVSSVPGVPAPSLTYTPYYVTGIPTLYPGKTQTIRPAFVIDNKSEYYVNSDYISRVTLKQSGVADFNGIMNYMSHEWKRTRTGHTNSSGTLWTADPGFQAIGGPNIAATTTSGITSSKFIRCRILHKNIYGDGVPHDITHNGNVRWFIYDKKTYELMDNNDSLTHVHLTFPNQSAGHQGTSTSFTTSYRKITMLNPPSSKFNPSTETTNLHISTSSSNYFNNSSNTNTTGTLCEWSQGVFDGQISPDSTHNCLAMYDGKFQSPSALRTGSYGFGNTNNVNYPEIVTLYNHYVVDSTAANKWLGNPASHYADNYRWAFYKFVFQNSANSAVTPVESQIFLADGNDNDNTNIDFSDLLSSEGTTNVTSSPKVKVCVKTFFAENGSTWEVSGWNQIISGPTATNPAAPSASELNNDLTIPTSGNGNSNVWTNAVGKKKSGDFDELGNSGAVPSDATWKAGCRRLPFKHGKMKLNKQVKAWHIIAIGFRNDVSRYIGNVYISRKYDDSG